MPEERKKSQLSATEEEVIFLKATFDAINNMANCEVMTVTGGPEASTVHFNSMTHRRYFNLLLVDFLSKTDPKGKVRHNSFLGALKEISDHPEFDKDGSVSDLRKAVGAFVAWLEEEIVVDTWLASISLQVDIKIKRVEYLKICGDLSKHNFLRAVSVADRLVEILRRSGKDISRDQALISFEDFDARFHQDIFVYHATLVVAYLNDIRWGIFRYLQPEFSSSIKLESGEHHRYSYTCPNGVDDEFAIESYWELMNLVRNTPYFPRFKPWKYVTLQH